jgi:hypothetical protein
MRRTVLGILLGAGFAAGLALAAPRRALAQANPGGPNAEELQRLGRIDDLERLNLDTRLRANPDIPPGQRLLLDYGGYLTFNYLSLDDSVGDNHVLRETEAIGYLRANFDGAHELFLRGRWGWRDFNEGDSFDGRGDEPIDGDLDRGYYRFDLNRYRQAYGGAPAGVNLIVQGGRDLVYWGNGLVLAQVLDGGVVTVGNERLTLQLVAGVTPTRTVDIDSSRPQFDHNTRRAFYGGMLTATVGEHQPYVYALAQQDHNQADFRSIGFVDTSYEYNSYYVGVGSAGAIGGRLRYGVEAAYEFGDTLSNSFDLQGFGIVPVEQTEDDISAFALDARLDYFFPDARQTRLSGEIILATGDTDRGHTSNTFNGNEPDTTDNAFNAFGLLNTGLAFAPDVSNIVIVRGGVQTFPFAGVRALERLQVGADLFFYSKFYEGAPIDETTGSERFLGWEPDVYLNWQVTSDVTLALRYGVFFPSEDNFALDDARHFFYGGVTFAF